MPRAPMSSNLQRPGLLPSASLVCALVLSTGSAWAMPDEKVLTIVSGDEIQLSGGEEVCFTFDQTDYRELQVRVRIRFPSFVPRGHLMLDDLRSADFVEPSEEFSFWVNPRGLHRLTLELKESATTDRLQLVSRGVELEHGSCEGYEDQVRQRMEPLDPPRPDPVNRLSSGAPSRDLPDDIEPDEPPTSPPLGTLTLPAGTELELILEDELSSSQSHVGQQFRARLGEDLLLGGDVALRAGAILTGHVTEAQDAGRFGTSKLGLQIDSVLSPQGDDIALRASLQRVGKGSGKKKGGIIAGSALGGALLGQLLGGDKEATILGAALGGGIAAGSIAAQPGEAVTLAPGTVFQVRLEDAATLGKTQAQPEWEPGKR